MKARPVTAPVQRRHIALPIRRLLVVAATAAVATVLASCSLGPSTSGSPAGADSAAKNSNVTIDLSSYPSTLDPALQYDESTYSVYRNIYDQLLRRDPSTGKPIPWIATKWSNPTPTEWQFTIRKGVKFSDGTPLTAADVAFSIGRIINPATNSPQFANFSVIKSATAPNATTVLVTTTAPSPTVLTYMTTLSIVSKAYVTKVGNATLNVKPLGSGAYELSSDISGSQVVLKRNPDYWGKKPSIARVTFEAVPDGAARVADLQSGKATLAADLTADEAGQIKGSPSVKVLSAPTERVAYLGINVLGNTPTSNLQLRQAIHYAINYKSIVKNLEGGYGSPVGTVLTPLSFGYPSTLANNEYDPAKAKALVKASGVSDPKLTFATSPSYDPELIQTIQSDLQAVGITVNISNTDQATYLSKVQDKSHDWGSLRVGLWSCSCLDADGVLLPLFHSGSIWSSYSNTTFDALVDDARTTLSAAKRKSDYAKAVAIINKDLPGIGLYQVDSIYGAASSLTWKPDAVQSMYVDQMTVTGK